MAPATKQVTTNLLPRKFAKNSVSAAKDAVNSAKDAVN